MPEELRSDMRDLPAAGSSSGRWACAPVAGSTLSVGMRKWTALPLARNGPPRRAPDRFELPPSARRRCGNLPMGTPGIVRPRRRAVFVICPLFSVPPPVRVSRRQPGGGPHKGEEATVSATEYISGLGLNATVDGYVVVLVHDPARGAADLVSPADLVSLAAQDVAAEPVAHIHLSATVPPGSHGNSAPER